MIPSASDLHNTGALRGLCAIVVFLSHVVQIFVLPFAGLGGLWHEISSFLSFYAVFVFFLISGYLIAYSCDQNASKNAQNFDLLKFIFSRFARIYPPFVFSVAISIFVFFVLMKFDLPGGSRTMVIPGASYSVRDFIYLSFRDVVDALLMKRGMENVNGPLWSLYIEVKLYLIYALVVYASNGLRALIFCGLLLVLTYSTIDQNPEFLRYATIWLFGAAFFLAQRQRRPLLLVVAAAVTAIILLDAGQRTSFGMFQHLPEVTSSRYPIVLDLVVAGVLGYLILVRRISFPGGATFEPFSYSLYIFHFPILLLGMSLAVEFGGHGIQMLVLGILSSVVALAVSVWGGYVEALKPSIERSLLSFRAWGLSRLRGGDYR